MCNLENHMVLPDCGEIPSYGSASSGYVSTEDRLEHFKQLTKHLEKTDERTHDFLLENIKLCEQKLLLSQSMRNDE